jgi:hypothetical protein
MMKVSLRASVPEIETNATGQRFAPKELMIPVERWTEGIRIFVRWCVRPEVEADINI